MTISEKLEHIENALTKIRTYRDLAAGIEITSSECDAVEAALEVAAGICILFKEKHGIT
jgi:hypothetical protein